MIGMAFILIYLLIGLVRIIIHLPPKDRKRYLISLIIPRIFIKNIWDIICEVLIHVKIWKRKPLLGYMHSSIAFGWFMLIVLGHVETLLYAPQRTGLLYYPVFFRFFVMETNHTMRGAFLFFLMDLFLLIVLSGVFLAMFKRIRSQVLGMRRTTKNSLWDRIAMYCLWAIFPVRLLAESFTAGISGGSFLTKPMYWLFSNFLNDTYHIVPTWWVYSSVLGLFFLLLPFTRYMHIPTEAFLITLRNAGLKARHPRNGYSEAEIYSCSSCGLCLDACPMGTQRKNLKYSSVYYIRFLRRRNKKKCKEIADKCMMCGKCVAICPVGVDSCRLKQAYRELEPCGIKQEYRYLSSVEPAVQVPKEDTVLFYAGCMTHLTPIVSRSVTGVLEKAGINYSFMDADGGLCCGRPLLLAGKTDAANELIRKNTELIAQSGATTLLLSCPICYKVFKENYKIKGIKVVHYTEYFNDLVKSGKITLKKGIERLVYHDPCELGRGTLVYDEPRNVLSLAGELVPAEKEGKESICCGGSLGSLTLSYQERQPITDMALRNLYYSSPDKIVTACPLCLKTFAARSDRKVADFAEVVLEKME